MNAFRKILALVLLVATWDTQAAVMCSGTSTFITFGAYDVFNPAPLDGTANLIVTCNRQGGPQKVTVEVAIGSSLTSGSISNRQMNLAGGTDRLNYNLYRDAARSSVWGQTSSVDTVTQFTSVPNHSSTTLNFSIFGRIFPQQNAGVGSYSDSLVITLTY